MPHHASHLLNRLYTYSSLASLNPKPHWPRGSCSSPALPVRGLAVRRLTSASRRNLLGRMTRLEGLWRPRKHTDTTHHSGVSSSLSPSRQSVYAPPSLVRREPFETPPSLGSPLASPSPNRLVRSLACQISRVPGGPTASISGRPIGTQPRSSNFAHPGTQGEDPREGPILKKGPLTLCTHVRMLNS